MSDYATTSAMNAALANKVGNIPGKGLSTNDFTDTYKQKIDNLDSTYIGGIRIKDPDNSDVPVQDTIISASDGVYLPCLYAGNNISLTKMSASETGTFEPAFKIEVVGDDETNTGFNADMLDGKHASDFATVIAMNEALSGKVDKVAGKGLSTNDFTDSDKTKVNDAPGWVATPTAGNVPKIAGAPAGWLTDSGFSLGASVPADAVFTDTHYKVSLAMGGLINAIHSGGNAEAEDPYIGFWENGAMSAYTRLMGIDGLTAKSSVGGTLTVGLSEETKSRLSSAEESVTDLDTRLTLLEEDFSKTGWTGIRNAVRMGLGPTFFPVGYEFSTYDSDTGTDIIWVVRAHDHHAAADSTLTHTMTLETKYVYSNANGTYREVQFCAPEALYYAEEGLAAGTYNFTWEYTIGAMEAGTYQFTLAQAVPAGGQIVLGTKTSSSAITSCKIATYGAIGGATAIESGVTVVTGSDGVSLGAISSTSSTAESLNCLQYIISGSNNYAQSAARQWLNSAAAAGSVWTPQTKFDRPPSWATTYNGFMYGLPEEFLAAVQPASIPCRTNPVVEIASLDGTEFTVNTVYTLEDKFFFLSRPEIYGDWDDESIKDGTQLEYYADITTNAERIKRDAAGSACYCWLRSPSPNAARTVRLVNTNGSLYAYYSHFNYAAAPACIIA